jgi:hypothetical protein
MPECDLEILMIDALFCFCFSTRLISKKQKMLSQAPAWSLSYKNLGSNPDVNLKMQRIIDFNHSQLSQEVGFQI